MTRVIRVISRLCFAGSLLFALSAAANATPVCVTGTLASYLALDQTGGCTIGDYSIFRFSFPAVSTSGNPPVADASQILVTPISTSAAVGFDFTASANGTNLFSIPNPTQSESVTYHLGFTIDPPPAIPGADLSLDPPFGDVSATQNYCLFDVFADNCTLGTQAQQTVTTTSPFSQLVFATPSSFIDVQTNITLNASPGHPAGFDGLISEFLTTAPTPVPEPKNVLLTGFGVCALLFFLRRSRRLGKSRA